MSTTVEPTLGPFWAVVELMGHDQTAGHVSQTPGGMWTCPMGTISTLISIRPAQSTLSMLRLSMWRGHWPPEPPGAWDIRQSLKPQQHTLPMHEEEEEREDDYYDEEEDYRLPDPPF